MAVISCSYITPMRGIAITFLVIGFVIHAVGLSKKKWDGIDLTYPGYFGQAPLHYLAYQNLWNSYDLNRKDPSQAIYGAGSVADSVPEWKKRIIYIETTGLGLAFIAWILVLFSSFFTKAATSKKTRVAMAIVSIIACFAAAAESIVGVKLYQEDYLKVIGSGIGKLITESEDSKGNKVYDLTSARYFCMGAGGTYGLVGLLLIVDLIIAAAKGKSTTPVVPVVSRNNSNAWA